MVVNATTGSELLMREQEIVGDYEKDVDVEIGTYMGKFHWELGTIPYTGGSEIPSEYTEYYTRLTKDGDGLVTCYVKKPDDVDWKKEYSTESKYQFGTITLMFGNDIRVLTQYWDGSINLSNSYIIIGSTKYLFKRRA